MRHAAGEALDVVLLKHLLFEADLVLIHAFAMDWSFGDDRGLLHIVAQHHPRERIHLCTRQVDPQVAVVNHPTRRREIDRKQFPAVIG